MAQINEWQEKCTTEFTRCLMIGSNAGANEWKIVSKRLVVEAIGLKHKHPRVILADLILRKENLSGWNFDHCYITRVDFTDANLSGATFDRSILRECRLVRADLRGAKFSRTGIDSTSIGWSVYIDKKTGLFFSGMTDNLSGFDPHFRRRAEEDQRIHDIRSNGYTVLRFWYELIDYGRSIWSIFVILTGVSLLFACIYGAIYRVEEASFEGEGWNLLHFWIMSAQRLINAPGFIESKLPWVQAVFLAEAAIGYGALALLAAVLLRKLTVLE